MSIVLREIDFGTAFVSSGTLNFFGEGWRNHKILKMIFPRGFDCGEATFIAKTTTLYAREGNMSLRNDLQPMRLIPDCIKINYSKGIMLNAVGLSGPGAEDLFYLREWQKRKDPFFISFMSLGETVEDQVREAEKFVAMLLFFLDEFQTDIGIQVNGSCPNTEHSTSDVFASSLAILEPFQKLGIPIDYKIGVADALTAGVTAIKEIERSGLCDCLTCSNTIPWGKLPELINWPDLFGSDESPLKKYGGGGLSGKPLKPIVESWLRKVRSARVTMPVKAGGGVLGPDDALDFLRAGADGVEIGAMSQLRPFRVRDTIEAINSYQNS